MAEQPTILTPRQECAHRCAVTSWRKTGRVEPGQVRRCEHGRIWFATGEKATGEFYNRLDVWERVSWFWHPIAYRRAVRALTPARTAPPATTDGTTLRALIDHLETMAAEHGDDAPLDMDTTVVEIRRVHTEGGDRG